MCIGIAIGVIGQSWAPGAILIAVGALIMVAAAISDAHWIADFGTHLERNYGNACYREMAEDALVTGMKTTGNPLLEVAGCMLEIDFALAEIDDGS